MLGERLEESDAFANWSCWAGTFSPFVHFLHGNSLKIEFGNGKEEIRVEFGVVVEARRQGFGVGDLHFQSAIQYSVSLYQSGRSVVGLPESEDSFEIGDDWCPSNGLLHDIDKLDLSLGIIKVVL